MKALLGGFDMWFWWLFSPTIYSWFIIEKANEVYDMKQRVQKNI